MSSDEENPQKFANMHYPGIKVDPNEGRGGLDERATYRFSAQIACLGPEAQRRLLSGSAFVVGATPLGVVLAKRLLEFGFGRVGVFGNVPVTGAHGLGEPTSSALGELSKWAKANAPWAEFEAFREASIDRSLEDMIRGFGIAIGTETVQEAGKVVALARDLGVVALLGQVTGQRGWCAEIPPAVVCEDCLQVPLVDADENPGLYFPLVDYAATWLATAAVDVLLHGAKPTAFVDSFDASHSPWMRQTREATPRTGCPKCDLKK